MEKTLIITEKPSVAADVVKALKEKFDKQKTHYENERYIVSFALGHLLTICEPQEIDEKYKSWSFKALPILPEKYLLKPITSSKGQLKVLASLIKKKEVTHIINACDAGREGELIFRYIMEYIPKKSTEGKKISRLWLQSMTQDAIRKGFENLKEDKELLALSNAAKSRSEADWLIGINGSRGLTSYISKYGGFFITPCGRVQTPTLSIIVKRENERKSFVNQDYWNIFAKFQSGKQTYEGKWFDAKFKKKKSEEAQTPERLWNKKEVEDIIKNCDQQAGSVTEKTKTSLQKSPLLYDLTTLQREANSRFGFSAKQTLSIAQALYERHKVLTYPRTSSRYLPEDYLGIMKQLFLGLKDHRDMGRFAAEALEKDYVKFDKRVFNNQKVSDHHAIIPTNKIPGKINEVEQKIYQMVLQRTLAIFFPPAKYLLTTRISTIKEHTFKTEGKILEIASWKAIYGSSEADTLLQSLQETTTLAIKVTHEQNQTKPPGRFTESSLLSAMEGAGKFVENEELKEALKERGIGTPATRAQVIEKLISDKYIVREDKNLIPTTKAFELISLLKAMQLQNLQSAELTGEWEYKLTLIEKNQLSRETFMNSINEEAKTMIEKIKSFDEDTTKKEATFSPIGEMKYYETIMRYFSEDKSIVIRKMMGGRIFSNEEVCTLIKKGKIGPLEGFRSKRGNAFTASIVLENKKAKFVFSNNEVDESIDLKESVLVGHSPVDNTEVYQTLNAYISKSAIEKKDTGLKINRIILGKEIKLENMTKLLNKEKTELITGFRSSKTKRLFDAYLELDEKGKIKFSFPERKKKAKK